MTNQAACQPTIVILGGGVSGVLTAYHLRRLRVRARVVVVEPRAELGLGLAYATPSERHLLNVPAEKISALPDEPRHFLRWLQAHHDADALPGTFAPRLVFGRYIRALTETSDIEVMRASAVHYRASHDGAVITLDDGREIMADRVVLALGNFEPAALPGIDDAATSAGTYCHNAWTPATYAGLAGDAPVILIGTGLTAVDVLLRLRELGHRGTITAISRHGALPNRHAAYTPRANAAIPMDTEASCVAYLRALRAAMHGAEWRAAVDSLRATTNELWLRLPLQEQKRFRRHLQRRWEVVRHRMAPPIADAVEAELRAGTLRIRNGQVNSVQACAGNVRIAIHTPPGEEVCTAARVINCTGPSMQYERVGSPLLSQLFMQGVVRPGSLGGGFDCAENGALIDAEGKVSEELFNVGPGRLGTLLESIAIPEIREQAFALAALVTEQLGSHAETGKRLPNERARRQAAGA